LIFRSYLFQHLQSVFARHADVENEDVKRVLLEPREDIVSIACFPGNSDVGCPCDNLFQSLAEEGVIVGNEHPYHEPSCTII
jgi:hypothetical protein